MLIKRKASKIYKFFFFLYYFWMLHLIEKFAFLNFFWLTLCWIKIFIQHNTIHKYKLFSYKEKSLYLYKYKLFSFGLNNVPFYIKRNIYLSTLLRKKSIKHTKILYKILKRRTFQKKFIIIRSFFFFFLFIFFLKSPSIFFNRCLQLGRWFSFKRFLFFFLQLFLMFYNKTFLWFYKFITFYGNFLNFIFTFYSFLKRFLYWFAKKIYRLSPNQVNSYNRVFSYKRLESVLHKKHLSHYSTSNKISKIFALLSKIKKKFFMNFIYKKLKQCKAFRRSNKLTLFSKALNGPLDSLTPFSRILKALTALASKEIAPLNLNVDPGAILNKIFYFHKKSQRKPIFRQKLKRIERAIDFLLSKFWIIDSKIFDNESVKLSFIERNLVNNFLTKKDIKKDINSFSKKTLKVYPQKDAYLDYIKNFRQNNINIADPDQYLQLPLEKTDTFTRQNINLQEIYAPFLKKREERKAFKDYSHYIFSIYGLFMPLQRRAFIGRTINFSYFIGNIKSLTNYNLSRFHTRTLLGFFIPGANDAKTKNGFFIPYSLSEFLSQRNQVIYMLDLFDAFFIAHAVFIIKILLLYGRRFFLISPYALSLLIYSLKNLPLKHFFSLLYFVLKKHQFSFGTFISKYSSHLDIKSGSFRFFKVYKRILWFFVLYQLGTDLRYLSLLEKDVYIHLFGLLHQYKLLFLKRSFKKYKYFLSANRILLSKKKIPVFKQIILRRLFYMYFLKAQHRKFKFFQKNSRFNNIYTKFLKRYQALKERLSRRTLLLNNVKFYHFFSLRKFNRTYCKFDYFFKYVFKPGRRKLTPRVFLLRHFRRLFFFSRKFFEGKIRWYLRARLRNAMKYWLKHLNLDVLAFFRMQLAFFFFRTTIWFFEELIFEFKKWFY
jgi:hypothetical protein